MIDRTSSFTTDDLVAATTPERIRDGELVLNVADGWQQGRGAFGGLVLGALARAIDESEPDRDRRMRTLSGELVGPVLPGLASVRVEPLRRGNAVSTLCATLTQAGEVLAQATAVLGRARATQASWAPAPPPELSRPWSTVDVAPVGPPFAPSFAQFLEMRPVGPLPFSGAADPVASGWVRPKRTPPALGPAELVALADAWWPAPLAAESAPRPVATIAFTIQLVGPQDPLDPAEPLFHRARAIAARDGYVVEHRELWTCRGELVSLNEQTIVWIK